MTLKKKINDITGALGHMWEHLRGFSKFSKCDKSGIEEERYDPNSMERIDINEEGYRENNVYYLKTKYNRNGRGSWTLRQKIIFLISILSVIIISAFIIMQMIGSSSSDKEYVSFSLQQEDTDDQEMGIIASAPVDIGSICSIKNIQTEDGLSECEEICTMASCCVMAETMDGFCFIESNWKQCYTYKECESVHPVFGLLEMPTTSTHDVTSACSENSMETVTGRAYCEDVCSSAKCCFLDEETDKEIEYVVAKLEKLVTAPGEINIDELEQEIVKLEAELENLRTSKCTDTSFGTCSDFEACLNLGSFQLL